MENTDTPRDPTLCEHSVCKYRKRIGKKYCAIHQKYYDNRCSVPGCGLTKSPDTGLCFRHTEKTVEEIKPGPAFLNDDDNIIGKSSSLCKDKFCKYRKQPDGDYCRIHQKKYEMKCKNDNCFNDHHPDSLYCAIHDEKIKAQIDELLCISTVGDTKCKNKKNNGLKYCEIHKHFQDYTPEMLANTIKCNRCARYEYLEDKKTCSKCSDARSAYSKSDRQLELQRERMKQYRQRQREKLGDDEYKKLIAEKKRAERAEKP